MRILLVIALAITCLMSTNQARAWRIDFGWITVQGGPSRAIREHNNRVGETCTELNKGFQVEVTCVWRQELTGFSPQGLVYGPGGQETRRFWRADPIAVSASYVLLSLFLIGVWLRYRRFGRTITGLLVVGSVSHVVGLWSLSVFG
jgi:hypothetical protein